MGWPDASLRFQGMNFVSDEEADLHAAPITSETNLSADAKATKVVWVIPNAPSVNWSEPPQDSMKGGEVRVPARPAGACLPDNPARPAGYRLLSATPFLCQIVACGEHKKVSSGEHNGRVEGLRVAVSLDFL